MLDISRIEKILENRGMTKVSFYDKIGITKTGFQDIKARGDMKVSLLIRICNILEVDINHFFDGAENMTKKEFNIADGPNSNYGIKNEMLEKRVSDLEDIIAAKDEIIKLLKKGN